MVLEKVPYLLYEIENEIAWIKFNRPERMNAILGNSQERGTVAKVGEYMRAADDDPNVRVIVLTGVGRAFCAGADLRGAREGEDPGDFQLGNHGMREGADSNRENFYHGFTKLHYDISYIRKPTIAMINGPAVGSGMDMALGCDIRIGCENTRFVAYHQVGQIIENGGSFYLPRIAGLGRALEFAYTGHLDADRAYQWGILNHLVSSDTLEKFTIELCQQIIGVPPLPQWISKRIMRASLESSFETVRTLTSNASGILATSADAVEARQAFIEKRKPIFKGI